MNHSCVKLGQRLPGGPAPKPTLRNEWLISNRFDMMESAHLCAEMGQKWLKPQGTNPERSPQLRTYDVHLLPPTPRAPADLRLIRESAPINLSELLAPYGPF
jgi:hypothetical protein